MSPVRRVAIALLVVAAASCEPAPQEPAEVVELPPEHRALLFGHTEGTTLVRQEIGRLYENCRIEFSGTVLLIDGAFDRSPWPVWMSVHVPGTGIDCEAHFDSGARQRFLFLKEGDSVTVVGSLCPDGVWGSSVKFYACKLIRAERDGKQIYPPEGDSPDREAGGEK